MAFAGVAIMHNKRLKKFLFKNAWLSSRSKEFESMFQADCLTDAHRELLLKLLENGYFLSQKDYSQAICSIISKMEDEIKQGPKSLIIAATAMDRDPDSAQSLMYSIKIKLGRSDYQYNTHLINNLNRLLDEVKRTQVKTAYWVDEFVGTGKTLVGRYKDIKSRLSNAGYDDLDIRVCVVAATEEGILLAKANGIDIESEYVLPKGLLNSSCSIYEDYWLLKGVCNNFSLEDGKEVLNILGWGNSEVVYGREEGNTPNNVLPVFWWGKYKNGARRTPVLSRFVGG